MGPCRHFIWIMISFTNKWSIQANQVVRFPQLVTNWHFAAGNLGTHYFKEHFLGHLYENL